MRAADVLAVSRIERAAFGRDAWSASAFAYLLEVFRAVGPPRGRFWVAHGPRGRIVGYAGVELSALGSEADIVNLAVDPAWRRRGVGTRLLATAAAFCRARRIPLVWLRARVGNRAARTFYRGRGFRPVGRFRDYYDDPREDAILMALSGRPPGARREGSRGGPIRSRPARARSVARARAGPADRRVGARGSPARARSRRRP